MTSPEAVLVLLRRAQLHHARQDLAEAEALYRQVLTLDPDNAPALGLLALILVDRPDDPQAEAVILRHLALRPNDGASLHALGQLRAREGNDEAAATLFQRAGQWLPSLAPIPNDLGVSLHRLGREAEGLAAFDRALALDPAYGAAHGNRGAVLYDLGRFAEAFEAQRQALACTDPAADEARTRLLDGLGRAARKSGRLVEAETVLRAEIAAGRMDAEVVEQLSLGLEAEGRAAEALALRNDLARRLGVQRRGAACARTTVLVLGAVGAGHVPIRYLLDEAAFATLQVSLLSPDQPDAPLGPAERAALAEADVVFSTLGDADRDGGQLAAAAALCRELGLPVVNPPDAIARTGRDRAQGLFGDIPGMVTPPVARVSPEALANLVIDAPILARPAGDHGGDNLVKLDDEAAKAAWLAKAPGERLLVSPFCDFRSADGHWRKYRLIFVDRKVHPYHLAIGESWLVHYWRAEMGRADWKKAEEQRFLADWRSVFGPLATAAAEEAARRLDLDYGGMDCALLPDGRLLLFEANACMLVHLDEARQAFPYKHRYVPPIREAFTRLVEARGRREAASRT
ncbi:MAG: tetratricopeptide repeat protein [Caulobacteraceae bacterium]|nr:tetratricopeptide repeat protein [Caulobacteraceae bacterium]